MPNHKIEQTLQIIHQLLSGVEAEWMIIGTTSLYLHGYPVQPNDIDILCRADVVSGIENALKLYNVPFTAPIIRTKFSSVFSRYVIERITVEVMGDLQVNTPKGWIKLLDQLQKPEEIQLNGSFFKIPSKADQLLIYRLFGREKDKVMIEMLVQ